MVTMEEVPETPQNDQLEKEKKFNFDAMPGARFPNFEVPSNRELTTKWGIAENHSYLLKMRYDEFFQKYEAENFVHCLFNDPQFIASFKVLTSSGALGAVGRVEKVKMQELKASHTSLEFFDRLKEEGIVSEHGDIRKTFDNMVSEILISDKLRESILDDSSELYDVWSSEDRKELLFHIFKRFVTGGPICQYEDSLEPYLEVTKALYKDLLSVTKNANTGKMDVSSVAFEITDVDGDYELFPRYHVQNWCYVVIEPLKRHVSVWYHAFVPYF